MSVVPALQESVFGLITDAVQRKRIVVIRALIASTVFALVLFCCVFGPSKVGRLLHRYRFAAGAAVVFAAVALNISGSSLGMWNFWLGHDMASDVVWGTPRALRTDEYVVTTPFAFAQSYTGYSYFNNLFGNKPADMFIVKDAPVWTFAEIFRPFHWGYLILGSSRGLAFYWSGRLVALFLASYEFFLCVTNENGKQEHQGVAVLGASLIAFAPLIQWWYAVNSLPEMLVAVFVSIVCFNKYLTDTGTLHRTVYAGVILLCAGMFALTLYPAWQIPLAYLLIVLIAYSIVRQWGNIHISRKDVLILAIEVIVFIALMASVLITSWDTIQVMMHTAYPGARRSHGGGKSLLEIIASVCTLFLPYKEWIPVSGASISNSTEVSAFIDLFPVGIVLAIANMVKSKKIDVLNTGLITLIVFFMTFACVGFPLWLSKVLMLTPVTSSRTTVVLGVANIILLVRSVSLRNWEWNKRLVAVAAVIFAILIGAANHYTYPLYVGRLLTVVSCAITIMLMFSFLTVGRHIVGNIAASLTVAGLVISGMSVNPIQYGTAPMTQQPLVQQVQTLQRQNPGMWITDGDESTRIANLLVANGVQTLNALKVTPDLTTWRKLDSNRKSEKIYNRYAYISVKILEHEAKKPFVLQYGDEFTLQITPAQLDKLGVKNVLSTQKLDQMTFTGYKFVAIGKTIDGRTPYRLVNY
ncbi:hypothetical protein JS530_09090 [Bifidobacterium sp. LC6]|uniref:Uncharacterized protein n=1 Tax=Bifidobacterium colobi TaxID=2809026 RepID=A0ABS5UZZ5_9BIFI|nr:hypothetical protein [Bifidobacterium colobi]